MTWVGVLVYIIAWGVAPGIMKFLHGLALLLVMVGLVIAMVGSV